MSGKETKICETKRCHGDGSTEPMTHAEYLRRSAFGRLVYCEVCREREPARRLTGRTARPIPLGWLARLRIPGAVR